MSIKIRFTDITLWIRLKSTSCSIKSYSRPNYPRFCHIFPITQFTVSFLTNNLFSLYQCPSQDSDWGYKPIELPQQENFLSLFVPFALVWFSVSGFGHAPCYSSDTGGKISEWGLKPDIASIASLCNLSLSYGCQSQELGRSLCTHGQASGRISDCGESQIKQVLRVATFLLVFLWYYFPRQQWRSQEFATGDAWGRSFLSLIHIWRCRRIERCRSRWSPYH